jgi:hypothetical protein
VIINRVVQIFVLFANIFVRIRIISVLFVYSQILFVYSPKREQLPRKQQGGLTKEMSTIGVDNRLSLEKLMHKLSYLQ